MDSPRPFPRRRLLPARVAERDWPRLDLPNVLWFFGAITAGVASNTILDRVPESHSDLWVLLAALGFLLAYAVAAALLLWLGWWVPGGLAAADAVAMVPAAGYAFSQLVGIYPEDPFFDPFEEFSGTVFGIGLATLVAALLAYAATRFSFLLALAVAAALVAAQLLTPAWGTSADDRALTALVSGAAAVALGLLLDALKRRREAFWLYVGGYFAVGAALVTYILEDLTSGARGTWLALLIVGAVVLAGAALIRRASWAVYGALGVYAALFHYLDREEWVAFLLLAVALGLFLLGIVVARRRRPPQATERTR
jgi:hypothetical protein